MGDFHTMVTKSGKTFTPLDISDVLEVVRDEMGDEVYDVLNSAVTDIDLEREQQEREFNSDFFSISRENENWHTFVDDTSEEIEQLREKVETGKITKPNISMELFKIYQKMRKEL